MSVTFPLEAVTYKESIDERGKILKHTFIHHTISCDRVIASHDVNSINDLVYTSHDVNSINGLAPNKRYKTLDPYEGVSKKKVV